MKKKIADCRIQAHHFCLPNRCDTSCMYITQDTKLSADDYARHGQNPGKKKKPRLVNWRFLEKSFSFSTQTKAAKKLNAALWLMET